MLLAVKKSLKYIPYTEARKKKKLFTEIVFVHI